MSAHDLASVKLLHLLAGNLSMPGAPMLQLSLGYNPETGSLNGEAVITQAIAPPGGHVAVHHITGTVHVLGLQTFQQVFTVEGTYYVPFGPPPLIGIMSEKFSATFVTDSTWRGHGTFTYGNSKVKNVPIEQVK